MSLLDGNRLSHRSDGPHHHKWDLLWEGSPSAGFKYVEALGRIMIIIGGPYPPSNAIIYMR